MVYHFCLSYFKVPVPPLSQRVLISSTNTFMVYPEIIVHQIFGNLIHSIIKRVQNLNHCTLLHQCLKFLLVYFPETQILNYSCHYSLENRYSITPFKNRSFFLFYVKGSWGGMYSQMNGDWRAAGCCGYVEMIGYERERSSHLGNAAAAQTSNRILYNNYGTRLEAIDDS